MIYVYLVHRTFFAFTTRHDRTPLRFPIFGMLLWAIVCYRRFVEVFQQVPFARLPVHTELFNLEAVPPLNFSRAGLLPLPPTTLELASLFHTRYAYQNYCPTGLLFCLLCCIATYRVGLSSSRPPRRCTNLHLEVSFVPMICSGKYCLIMQTSP